MKNKFNLFLVSILSILSCTNKEVVEISLFEQFPFQNDHFKLEIVSTLESDFRITDMWFVSEEVGFFVNYGGELYKTVDKGNTWSLKYENFSSQVLAKILFIDNAIGFVAGGEINCSPAGCDSPGGIILRTLDGGDTWESIFEVAGPVEFNAISVNENGDLFTFEKGINALEPHTKILKSTDLGVQWDSVASFDQEFLNLFFDKADGFCIGNGMIVQSTDNGVNWDRKTSISRRWIYDIDKMEDIGYCTADGIALYKTVDNGENWVEEAPLPFFNPVNIQLVSENKVLLYGAGSLLREVNSLWNCAIRYRINKENSWEEVHFDLVGGFDFLTFYSEKSGYLLCPSSRTLIKVTLS